ncbi:MAG TPA: hypothetical protein VGL33_05500 [Streptosporangiaceae bacterium]|jgi:hypothetical protein
MNAIPKSPGLIALVDRLRRDLGQGYFIEVPHWDSDRAAIGLGLPDDPRFLIYLAVQADSCEVYVECEIPARDDAADVPYDVTASGDYADYEQVLGIVRSHLAL